MPVEKINCNWCNDTGFAKTAPVVVYGKPKIIRASRQGAFQCTECEAWRAVFRPIEQLGKPTG